MVTAILEVSQRWVAIKRWRHGAELRISSGLCIYLIPTTPTYIASAAGAWLYVAGYRLVTAAVHGRRASQPRLASVDSPAMTLTYSVATFGYKPPTQVRFWSCYWPRKHLGSAYWSSRVLLWRPADFISNFSVPETSRTISVMWYWYWKLCQH